MELHQARSFAYCCHSFYQDDYRERLRDLFPKKKNLAVVGISDTYKWDDNCALSRWLKGEQAKAHERAAFVGYTDDVTVLTLRGSWCFFDWIHNLWQLFRSDPLNAAKNKYGKYGSGHIHEGWADYAHRIWTKLDEGDLFEVLADPNRHLYVIGHSLGGAVAKLLANRLQLELDIPVAGVCTFGAPRVGNNEFATEFSVSDTVQFMCTDDLVPLVPLAILGEYLDPNVGMAERLGVGFAEGLLNVFFGTETVYRYAGELVDLPRDGIVSLGSGLTQSQLETRKNSAMAVFANQGVGQMKQIHDAGHYLELLASACA